MNEYYVILDLENNLYLSEKAEKVIFKNAKEFFSKMDAGIFIKEKVPTGQYTVITVITVYRVTGY